MASEWVAREVAIAWHHKPTSLLPVRLSPIEDIKAWTHANALPDIAGQIPIQDFTTSADPDEYQRGVTLVLAALATGVAPQQDQTEPDPYFAADSR